MSLQSLILGTAAALALAAGARAAPQILAPPAPPAASVLPYVQVPAGDVAMRHVRVIDGTGAAPLEDQMVVLKGGRIVSIGPSGRDATLASGVRVLDLTGRTVIPGLVGMHDHMYYIARPNMD